MTRPNWCAPAWPFFLATAIAACSGDGQDLGTGRDLHDPNGSDASATPGTPDGGSLGGLPGAAAESTGAESANPEAPLEGAEPAPADPDAVGAGPEAIVTEDPEELLLDEAILGDAGTFECERVVTLAAVPLEAPPPFDVVIVADHSDSLSWSKTELIDGLSSLLDNVVGHDVRFFVLTPTQYGASSERAVDRILGGPLVTWRDPVSQAPYENAMTRYAERCRTPAGDPIACPPQGTTDRAFTLEGEWEFLMPEPIAAVTNSMAPGDVLEQQELITAAILALGGGASQVEQPICTLNRYILQTPELLPTNAVFLIISDEDDVSTPNDCAGTYHYEVQPSTLSFLTEGCETNCEVWRFSASLPQASRYQSYTCMPVDDLGQTFPEEARSEGRVLSTTDGCADSQSECSEAQLDDAQQDCGPGYVIEGCQVTCYDAGTPQLCTFDTTDPNLDACSQSIEEDGETYENLAAYCAARVGGDAWQACERKGLQYTTVSGPTGAGYLLPLVGATDILDMIRNFQLEADRHFGESGYAVAAIAHDPAFDCELATGQSYATTLRMVTDGPSDVFPICGSYAPALSEFDSFARTLLQTDYTLELAETESIEGVSLVGRDGTKRVLDTGDYSYDPASATLHLEGNALLASDEQLDVTLVDPCVPRVR